MGLTHWISIETNCIFYGIEIYRILQHTLSFGGLWGGEGGSILAGYVPLASSDLPGPTRTRITREAW